MLDAARTYGKSNPPLDPAVPPVGEVVGDVVAAAAMIDHLVHRAEVGQRAVAAMPVVEDLTRRVPG